MTAALRVALWLGGAPPRCAIRWLDGALAAAARFPGATAVAAGPATWLDLAADRAARAGLPSVGVITDLALDYLGWAQIMAAAARRLGATTILVDEASRPERFAEVCAIAELCEAAQLTHVVAIAPEAGAIHASRASGPTLQTVRITGPAVLGLRIAGSPVDEPATPSPAMRRSDLASLGLDPAVLGHRVVPPRASAEPRRTIERVADHLADFLALRAPATGREDRTGKETRAKGSRSVKGARGPKGE